MKNGAAHGVNNFSISKLLIYITDYNMYMLLVYRNINFICLNIVSISTYWIRKEIFLQNYKITHKKIFFSNT